ncbi:unnamed protein product [Calypogeia fissa]
MKNWLRGSSSQCTQASGLTGLKSDAHRVVQLNTSLYELYSPPGTPSMEVVFFHGFQYGDYDDAHVLTWRSGDESAIWPKAWLAEKFRDARLLSVSYNASVIKSWGNETIDMYIIAENLISDLLSANVGQPPYRPIVLVGHSFGGLVIKQICVSASREIGGLKRTSERSLKLTTFLDSIQGIFFYSTPHHGILDHVAEQFVAEGPFLEFAKTLSKPRARVNFDFDKLCGKDGKYHMWQIAGLGEGLPTKSGTFNDVVVEEGSARYGTSFNVVEGADHITVCRPMNKTSRSFSALTNFLEVVITDSKAVVHGLPNHPTDLQRKVFEVQQKLTNTPVLGIVGMGGIGKTTIAKELFNTISQQYEYTCFVDNVKNIPPHELTDWILNHFLRNGTRVAQNSLQWSHLEKKKTLITMDDVAAESHVRSLPRLDHFGNGSRLIFTTRDQGVLSTSPECEIYEVDFLNFDEANKLFCKHSFEQEGIPGDLKETNDHLEENVKRVVQKCDGLPLTLEVIGSYLRGHKTNVSIWKETICKLGKAQSVNGVRNDRVWASLRVSYDALSPEEQGMFIDAGTFFCEKPVDEALAAWSTAYEYSETAWANLRRTSMVKEISKTKWNRIWMRNIEYKEVWVHEQLRDLASKLSNGAMVSRSIVAEGTTMYPFSADEVGTQTRILQLDFKHPTNFMKQSKLRLDLLDKLQELKYLELVDVRPEGSSKNPSTKLSILNLRSQRPIITVRDGVPQDLSLPLLPISLENLKNLAILQLWRWKMQEDSLEALGKLSNLRILCLWRIEGPAGLLEKIYYLSQLTQLELADLKVTGLPESFGKLSYLATLVIMGCDKLASLPMSFGFLHALQELYLGHCRKLQRLPKSFGHLSTLTMLHIHGAERLETLPNGFENLASLKYLSLRSCGCLKRLPERFGLLPALQQLELVDCGRVKQLPDNFGQLKALQQLCICLSYNPEALPDNSGQSQRVADHFGELVLSNDFGNLASLTFLKIYGYHLLEGLPESFSLLSTLEELVLENFTLQRLPHNFGQLSALERLSIIGANGLEALPDSLGNLLSLEDFHIEANMLQRFPRTIGQLPVLRKLTVLAQSLSSLPEEIGNSSSLEILRMESCQRMETLPDSLERILSLRKVVLLHCSELKSLPLSLGRHFLPHQEGDSEMTSPVSRQASQTASTDGFWLGVEDCPFLHDSELQRLGWIPSQRKDGISFFSRT